MGSTVMTTDRAGFPREIERLARRLGTLDAKATVTLKGGTVTIYVETGAGVELPADPGPSPAEVDLADARQTIAEHEETLRARDAQLVGVTLERDNERAQHDQTRDALVSARAEVETTRAAQRAERAAQAPGREK